MLFSPDEKLNIARMMQIEVDLNPTVVDLSSTIEWISEQRRVDQKKGGVVVVTTGGDSCGMNAAIRSAVRIALLCGIPIFGSHRGYEGVIDGDIEKMSWSRVSQQSYVGGTMLMSARCSRFRTKDGRRLAAYNMIERGITGMIVIGGDGSLTGGLILQKEFAEFRADYEKERGIADTPHSRTITLVGIPGTIDNDLFGTEMSLGADTALQRIQGVANRLYSTMRSHQRIFVLEAMGNCCGWLAMLAGQAVDADYVLLPEKRPGSDWKEQLRKTVELSSKYQKSDVLLFLSENTQDTNGKSITLADVAEVAGTDNVRTHRIGHIQRGGLPSSRDSILGALSGVAAMRWLLDTEADQSRGPRASMVAFCMDNIRMVSLAASVKGTRLMRKMVRAGHSVIDLRSELFRKALVNFEEHRIAKASECWKSDVSRKKRLAIAVNGRIIAGMNCCLHMLVQNGLCSGMEVFYLTDGFSRKERLSSAKLFQFSKVSHTGGSAIGGSANYQLDPQRIRAMLQEHEIDWLVLIGDRQNIDIVAKVNNVIIIPTMSPTLIPHFKTFRVGEMCLGFDSALNSTAKALAVCRESTASLKSTALLVEVVSSEICIMAGLAIGAFDLICSIGTDSTIAPDQRIAQLRVRLENSFANDARHSTIILRSADTWAELGTAEMAKRIANGASFEVKHVVLGPLGDGFVPSAWDQITASLVAAETIKAIKEARGSGAVGLVAGMVAFVHAEDIQIAKSDENASKHLENMVDICRVLENNLDANIKDVS